MALSSGGTPPVPNNLARESVLAQALPGLPRIGTTLLPAAPAARKPFCDSGQASHQSPGLGKPGVNRLPSEAAPQSPGNRAGATGFQRRLAVGSQKPDGLANAVEPLALTSEKHPVSGGILGRRKGNTDALGDGSQGIALLLGHSSPSLRGPTVPGHPGKCEFRFAQNSMLGSEAWWTAHPCEILATVAQRSTPAAGSTAAALFPNPPRPGLPDTLLRAQQPEARARCGRISRAEEIPLAPLCEKVGGGPPFSQSTASTGDSSLGS